MPLPAGSIVLVGFMGSGKTEVGRALAERTGRRLIDVDDLVTSEQTVSEIFAAEGESGFRRREKKAIATLAKRRNAVIATGGGAVLDPANVKALKRAGVLIYLQTDADELTERLMGSRDRPLLRSAEGPRDTAGLRKRVSTLLTQRLPIYESAADITISTTRKAPTDIADEIVKRLERDGQTPDVQRVKVALEPSYNVIVGRALLARAPELVKLPRDAENACIVSHPRIRRLWGKDLEAALAKRKLKVTWATFSAGEQNKTLEIAARLSRAIARAGLHRGDVVFALGGGVVGDVGAFVASTYARGIAVVQVPTTLLAMVDAAIGGKTGVNLPQGKNLVGTFHQPIAVLADLDTLSTLPEREFRSALAEVIKYGFIADPGLIDLATNDPQSSLESLVVRCAKIKADVVASDEKEAGFRAILNYGHTFGHAIEALSVAGRTRKLHHGEAIAIGMVYAAAVSKLTGTSQDDVVDETRHALAKAGLPTTVEGVSWSDVLGRMAMDKKYAKGLRFVLLEKPGMPVVTRVPQKILERAFKEVAA